MVHAMVDAFYPLVRPEDFAPLSSEPKRAIVRHGMQPEEYRQGRTVGRPLETEHPFPQALKAKNITVTEWAGAHKVGRSRVKSWFLDGDGGRPIPRKFADDIAREFGVPATARTWRNGIKE